MRLANLGICTLLAGCLRAEHSLVELLPARPAKKAVVTPPVIHPFSGAGRGSPIQLGTIEGRTFAWVADADAKALQIVDLDALESIDTIPLGGAPSELVMLGDGSILAALRDSNELVRLSPGKHPVVRARIPIATEPVGLAVASGLVLVTSGWARTLTAVSADRFTREWTLPLGREPRTVVASAEHAFISHAVGAEVDVVNLEAHTVEPKSLRGRREGGFQTVGFPNQGFALARTAEGKLFAPRALAQTERATDFGWRKMTPISLSEQKRLRSEESDAYGGAVDAFAPETLDVAVLDAGGEPDLESLALRNGFSVPPCPLPRAALATPNGRLVVACVGSDTVVELDAGVPSPHHALIRTAKVAEGPTGLAWDDARNATVVWSQFTRQLTFVPGDSSEDVTALAAVTMPPIAHDERLARGRQLFHSTKDLRISKDGRACASCHPDGRDDGLVWQTKDGPRQTAMLSGRLEGTAPYGWLGQSKNVSEHLEKRTFRRLGGTGLPKDELDALVAYVESLRPPETKETESNLVSRGEAIFGSAKAQCANCHGSDGRTPDGLDHSVWSKTDQDATGLFDTPSLRHVAQTAPYFHDGRYKTLRELLHKVDGTMGHTKQLDEAEIDALEAFLVTR
jgi:mono/diheme cytochrome c family protein